LQINK